MLDLIAAAQEAGSPLRRAAGEVAALAPEPSASVLREVDAHLRVGFSEAEAWQSLADDPVWGSTARDLARSARTGEAVADTIHLHATRTREAHRDHLNKKARTVAVKSVGPMMACFLPAFILAGVVPIFVGIASRYLG
nr:type II secretion system F family protein [Propionibacterium freudenreichii]